MSNHASEFSHLPQNSETVAMLRSTDWASTSLGHPSTWPELLRVQLNICFESAFPIAVWWGPDLIQFYNDGYRPILGATKHPRAFGGPAIETWPDIWPTIGSMVEQVVRQGIAVKGEDMPLVLDRNGYPELCHFTFSYSPIRNTNGQINGMFTAAVETSERVRAARRQAFQLSLADALRTVSDPLEIVERAAALLGDFIGAGRAGYGDVDMRLQTVNVDGGWTDGRMSSLAGERRPLDSFGPNIIAELSAGRTLRLNDISADPRSAPYVDGYASIATKSLIVVPLLKYGELKAILYLHCAEPRVWTEAEEAIAEDVAQRTWDAVERANAERQLLSERAKLQAIVNTIPTGLIMMDEHGTLAIENDEWKRTWGGNAHLDGGIDYARYKGFWADSGEPVAPEKWPCFVSLKEGSAIHDVVIDIKRFNGTDGTIVVSSAPILDDSGRVIGAVAANMDITELRTAQINLLEADRRKDEFLAMLAHELRNPLAPISAAAQVLQLAKLDEARVRQTSQLIGRQVNHMASLLDDLLDMSRVTRGLVELDNGPLNIRDIVANAVEQVMPLIRSRRHHFALHLPPDTSMVTGDENRLVQVIANLLNNAAKYTQEGGNILLKIEVHATHVVIEVEDNGLGMAPALVARAFDLFAQAERTPDRSSGGLGLGLALVKSLTELHHGTVTCKSAGLGKGSTFTVCLPRLAHEAHLGAQQDVDSQMPQETNPLRIMVVDDNADAASMLAMLLEVSGHKVIIEHASRSALERARKDPPQVCLLDIGLPEIDGIELARRMRAQPETGHSLLIAVTGYGQKEDREKALAAGFDHHLVKPIDIAELAAILAEVSKA
jgi:signal transduction histidine kinase/ActR/RegA family two-component response regulator